MMTSQLSTTNVGAMPPSKIGSSRLSNLLYKVTRSPTLMRLPPEFVDLVAEFADAGVEFLVIGGHAFNAYSSKLRTTKDIDLLIRPTPSNRAKAVKALEAFGVPPDAVAALRDATPNEIVFFGAPPLRVDILQSVPAIDFEVSYPRRTILQLDGVEIPIISLVDLIANKKAVGRKRDLADVKILEAGVTPPNRSRRR